MFMLIIALVLALIGLVALVFAVVTSNELVAWVCIGASVLGVILLIIDAVRERQQRDAGGQTKDDRKDDRDEADEPSEQAEDYPDDADADSSAEATQESAAARDESAK
jgi:heme exporter protein D